MSTDVYPLVRDWLYVDGNRLVLRTGKVELGQRISTALIRIAVEELTVSADRIVIEPVRTGSSPDEGITSGSNSIEQSGLAQRQACATARLTALALAGRELNNAPESLDLIDGFVVDQREGRRIDLLELLADMPGDLAVDTTAPPRAQQEQLADMPPRGLIEMVEGRYTFIHDIERDGMLHARIVRAPTMKAVLTSIDEDVVERQKSAGIKVIRNQSFLSVAGTSEWSVVRAARSLANACTWDLGDGLETGDVFKLMRDRDAQKFAIVDGTPDPQAYVARRLSAPDYQMRFERPYTMHGALAPSAALATFRDGRLEILTHSQGLFFLRDSIADSLCMAPETIILEHVPGSGCYGHNGADDAAFEAALIARALPGTPVLLKFERADEHGREPVGTAMAVSIEAELTADNRIAAVWMEARGDTHRGRPRKGPNRAGPARLAANWLRETDVPEFVPEPNMNRHAGLHRNLDPVYDVGEKRLIKALVPDLPLRTSALRCLGAPANILAIESMMDELADRADVDPITFRLQHLKDPRAQAVLERLRRLLPDAPSRGNGAGLGIAYAQYKNSMTRVGIAVDLSVDEFGATRLEHVWLVADGGRVVDPDGFRAQLEGGVLQGASWALHEKVQWGPDGRETLDWDSYPVLRFHNIPKIAVEIISSFQEKSVGAGEASPGPTVAAIANGIFAATGLRLRRMPFDQDAIMQAALAN